LKREEKKTRLTLDPDEGVGDESLGVVGVGGLGSRRSLSDVRSVLDGIEAGEEVSRVKNETVSSDLTEETRERREETDDQRESKRTTMRKREEQLTRIRNW